MDNTIQTQLPKLFAGFGWSHVTLTAGGNGLPATLPAEYGYSVKITDFADCGLFTAKVKYMGSNLGMAFLFGPHDHDVSGVVGKDKSGNLLFELRSLTPIDNVKFSRFDLPVAVYFVGVALGPPSATEQAEAQSNQVSFIALKGNLEMPPESHSDLKIPFCLTIWSDPPGQVSIISACNATLSLQEVATLVRTESLASKWKDVLPEFSDTLGLTLTEVNLSVDISQSRMIAASATVRCAEDWKPFGSSPFTFDDIEITFCFLDSGVALSTTLAAQVTIAGVKIDAQVVLPGLSFYGELVHGPSAPLRPLLELFHLDGLGFDDAEISQLKIDGTLDAARMRFLISIENPLSVTVGKIKLALTELDIRFGHTGKPANTTEAGIKACFEINSDIALGMTADYAGPDGGWDFTGTAEKLSKITFNKIANDIAEKFGMTSFTLPGDLGECQVTSLALTLNTRTKAATARLEADWSINSASETKSHLSLGLAFSPAADTEKGYDLNLAGQIVLGNREFDLIFDKSSESSVLVCSYSNPAGDTVKLGDLIDAVEGNAKAEGKTKRDADADGISFTLKDALLAIRLDKSPKPYLFAVDLDTGVDLSGLSKLPLIGQALGGRDALVLSFQILAGTMADSNIPGKVAGLLPAGAPHVPGTFKGPFQLITTLKLGGETQTISLGAGQNNAEGVKGDMGSPQPSTADSDTNPAAAVAKDEAKVKWFTLQKHFGPLSLSRIGVGYDDHTKTVDALLDASFAIGPLSLALEGLGAEYNTASKSLCFTLRGGALAFQKGEMTLAAAFLRLGNDLAGLGMLRFGELGITVLGAIGEAQGHPSFFIYAAIDYPLGGPAFFFVEGLALGFGVNRRLLMPVIGEVSSFPLVAAALGSIPMPTVGADDMASVIEGELLKLEKYVPPMLGEYFFAVGVRFTSFKLIRAFALLAMSVGKEFELDIIGIATLTHPPIGDLAPDAPVMVKVDLGLMARFVPDDGLLTVEAQLMSDSYLYDPRCHLVGGFAYYNWFSGEHAGDFVTTLGGYHPHFKAPAHYPQSVPRLGFNWQVTSEVLIKGGAYFALTPNAAMAGGFLSATYNSGDISAWFNCTANFLMYWKPFHYQASATVEIGAALTIHFFGTHHVTINAGADLDIWGPRFTGRAHVSVKVLRVHVHFTVDFGSGSQNAPPKLNWDDFQKAFLPADDKKVCNVSIARGLVRTVENPDTGAAEAVKQNSSRWIINSKELVLVTDSLVPSNAQGSFDVTPGKTDEHDPWPSATPTLSLQSLGHGKHFGIEPMGTTPGNLTSAQIIRVRKKDVTQWANASNEFISIPLVKRVPRALWSVNASATSSPSLDDEQTTDALTGYELHPARPPQPGTSCFIEDAKLAYDVNVPRIMSDTVFAATYTVTPPQVGDSQSVITAAWEDSTDNRNKILDDLGFSPSQDVALDETLAKAFVITPGVARFGRASA